VRLFRRIAGTIRLLPLGPMLEVLVLLAVQLAGV